MQVKTNIVLSVIVGDFPVIGSSEEYPRWKEEFIEFTKLLPVIELKGASIEKVRALNYEARIQSIYNACPEFNKIADYLQSARAVIKKHYASEDVLDKNYFDFCKSMIDMAEKTTGTFHYYDSNQAE